MRKDAYLLMQVSIICALLSMIGATALLRHPNWFGQECNSDACDPYQGMGGDGAGSTFASPVLAAWTRAYRRNTGLTIKYQPVGSITGITMIKSRRIDFGASDVPLQAEDLGDARMVQFPVIIGGVVPVVNLRGIGPGQLKLTGPVLADIFLGKIAYWDDKAIADLNPQLGLPSQQIIPVHRAADSGTRQIFFDYLAKVSPAWKRDALAGNAAQVVGGIGTKGNELVAAFTAAREGAIGYVEYAYAKQDKLAYVLLQNREGEFVAPSNRSFSAAAANAGWSQAPALPVLLTDRPGRGSWPIAGSTFLLVHRDQGESEAAVKMFRFFDWIYRDGAAFADDLDYAPIPRNVAQLAENEWAEVRMRDGRQVWPGSNSVPR
jgi:phosphate transport system substrate-binding protein